MSMDNSATGVTAVLGLSIEPLAHIQNQLSGLPSTLSKSTSTDLTKDPTALAEKIVRHLFNYISGFVDGGRGPQPESLIPMNIIAKWYDNFLGKVRAGGIGFLERGD